MSEAAVDTVQALAALRDTPEILDALVTEHADKDGNLVLVGYVTGPDPSLGTAWIHQQLMTRLPGHLIPRQLFVLDEIRMTPEGEYDLDALPVPDPDALPADSYVAPRTPVEQRISEVMRDFLDVGRVGIYDSFFALGGSSFMATQLTARLREIYGVEILLRDVFAAPTADGLARIITRTLALPDPERRKARRRRLRERAFRYVAGHPALIWVWQRARPWGRKRDAASRGLGRP
jgi:acyl carrier protein